MEIRKVNYLKWLRKELRSINTAGGVMLAYFGIKYADSGKDKLENATHFDTKEEAESWANSHQEVIEVVDV